MTTPLRLPDLSAHARARRWNRDYPVGTEVRELVGKRKGRISRTISEAWVNGAGECVVRLSGRFSGSSEAGVPLGSVEPFYEGVFV